MKNSPRTIPPYKTKAGLQIGLLWTNPNRYQFDYHSELLQTALLTPPESGGFFARIGRFFKAYI